MTEGIKLSLLGRAMVAFLNVVVAVVLMRVDDASDYLHFTNFAWNGGMALTVVNAKES